MNDAHADRWDDRAIAAYSRAHKWTPLFAGRYADEHGSAVRQLFQPEGLWGMTPTNAKLLVLLPDDQGGVPMAMSQTVRAILAEAERRRIPVEQIKVAA